MDEGLQPRPEMAQSCPWHGGKPVPQPLNDIVPQYGMPRYGVTIGQVFGCIAELQRLGLHAHTGFHGAHARLCLSLCVFVTASRTRLAAAGFKALEAFGRGGRKTYAPASTRAQVAR